MKTFLDNFKDWAGDITDLLKQLLENSSINASHYRGEDIWKELDDSSLQLQSKLLEEYQRFLSVLEFLISKQPKPTLRTFQENKQIILEIIQQDNNGNTYFIGSIGVSGS